MQIWWQIKKFILIQIFLNAAVAEYIPISLLLFERLIRLERQLSCVLKAVAICRIGGFGYCPCLCSYAYRIYLFSIGNISEWLM